METVNTLVVLAIHYRRNATSGIRAVSIYRIYLFVGPLVFAKGNSGSRCRASCRKHNARHPLGLVVKIWATSRFKQHERFRHAVGHSTDLNWRVIHHAHELANVALLVG